MSKAIVGRVQSILLTAEIRQAFLSGSELHGWLQSPRVVRRSGPGLVLHVVRVERMVALHVSSSN